MSTMRWAATLIWAGFAVGCVPTEKPKGAEAQPTRLVSLEEASATFKRANPLIQIGVVAAVLPDHNLLAVSDLPENAVSRGKSVTIIDATTQFNKIADATVDTFNDRWVMVKYVQPPGRLPQVGDFMILVPPLPLVPGRTPGDTSPPATAPVGTVEIPTQPSATPAPPAVTPPAATPETAPATPPATAPAATPDTSPSTPPAVTPPATAPAATPDTPATPPPPVTPPATSPAATPDTPATPPSPAPATAPSTDTPTTPATAPATAPAATETPAPKTDAGAAGDAKKPPELNK